MSRTILPPPDPNDPETHSKGNRCPFCDWGYYRVIRAVPTDGRMTLRQCKCKQCGRNFSLPIIGSRPTTDEWQQFMWSEKLTVAELKRKVLVVGRFPRDYVLRMVAALRRAK